MPAKFIWVAFNHSLDSSEEAIAPTDGEVRVEREVALFPVRTERYLHRII